MGRFLRLFPTSGRFRENLLQRYDDLRIQAAAASLCRISDPSLDVGRNAQAKVQVVSGHIVPLVDDTPNVMSCVIVCQVVVRHTCGMARDDLHFRLRIPEGLKELVEKSADANRRSMTAEIVARLERSFDLDDGLTALTDRVEELESMVEGQNKQIDKLMDWVDDLRVATHRYDPNGDD